MRKLITSSVLILLLIAFSGTVFAGKTAECEAIKKDPEFKGLYGLCNAYHNAGSENARNDILAYLEQRASSDMLKKMGIDTGEDFTPCPCWADIAEYEEQICRSGTPGGGVLRDDSGIPIGGLVILVDDVAEEKLWFGTDGTYCEFRISGTIVASTIYRNVNAGADGEAQEVLPEESLTCLAEMEALFVGTYCDG